MLETVLLVGAGVGAISSVVSAIASYLMKARSQRRITIKIGGKEIEITSATEAQLKNAVGQLQDALHEKVEEKKSSRQGPDIRV